MMIHKFVHPGIFWEKGGGGLSIFIIEQIICNMSDFGGVFQ